MTRYIAILTLALTAALSVDQAFAADVTQAPRSEAIAIPAFIGYIVDEDPYLDYCILREEGFTHPQAKSFIALCILAFHDGPKEAYETMRDMGYSHKEAKGRIDLIFAD